MRYFLIEEQSGGCDYTIGCGIRVTQLGATSIEAAREEANEKIDSDWHGKYEMAVTKAKLLAVQDVEDLAPFLNGKAAERAAAAARELAKTREADERATLARLQKKYGG